MFLISFKSPYYFSDSNVKKNSSFFEEILSQKKNSKKPKARRVYKQKTSSVFDSMRSSGKFKGRKVRQELPESTAVRVVRPALSKVKGSPVLGFFEKNKYFSYNSTVSVDHSFLWQQWVNSLSGKRDFYLEMQADLKNSLLQVNPDLTLEKNTRVNYLTKNFYYQLDNLPKQVYRKRRKVNFFTYRRFRFNQLRLFYTTCNQKQFKNLYLNYSFIKKRVLDYFLISLEGRLEFFLYRLNFFPSKGFIRQFINHHGVLVNGFIVRNKNYILKPFDKVSIPKGQYSQIFALLKQRVESLCMFELPRLSNKKTKKELYVKLSRLNISPLYSLSFFFNYPRYIEVDYVLLEAMFIRYPNVRELLLPTNSEVDVTNRSYYK